MFEHRIVQAAKRSKTPEGLELADKWTRFMVKYSNLYLQLGSLSEEDEMMDARFREFREERARLYQDVIAWNPGLVVGPNADGSISPAPEAHWEGPAVIESWDTTRYQK